MVYLPRPKSFGAGLGDGPHPSRRATDVSTTVARPVKPPVHVRLRGDNPIAVDLHSTVQRLDLVRSHQPLCHRRGA